MSTRAPARPARGSGRLRRDRPGSPRRPALLAQARRTPARRPRPRVRGRWLLPALAVLVVAGGLGYLLLGSPLLAAQRVQVAGTAALGVDEVVAAAGVPLGGPLLRVDTAEAAERVARLPEVARVRVSRSWPQTVRIEVLERVPVALRPAPDGPHRIDAAGVDFGPVAETGPPLPPLPELRAPDRPLAAAAAVVLTGLPAPLRDQVRAVTADSPENVRLVLADGRKVDWGSAADGPHKAAVLGVLLTQPGTVYDVSSPELPTIRR